MWDDRYREPGFAYGTDPNDFLAEAWAQTDIPDGPVLCLAEGEGRNSVWVAKQGRSVTGVDASSVGVEKTTQLARESGVDVVAIHGNLAEWDLGEAQWAAIVSVFAHMPPAIRKSLHARVVKALKPGGVLLLEAYTPRQVQHKTGGPVHPGMESLLMDPELLREELAGLEFERLEEVERDVVEGKYHTGRAAVVQVIGRKPAS